MITRNIFQQIQEVGGFKVSEYVDEIKLFGLPIYTCRKELSRQAVSLTTEIKKLCHALDSWECVYCGATQTKFHIDHVYPKVKGGGSLVSNLVTSCQPCNNSKGGHSPDEVGMKLQYGRYYQPDPERLVELSYFFADYKLCDDRLITRRANKQGYRIQELVPVRKAWYFAERLAVGKTEITDLELEGEAFLEEAREVYRMLYLIDTKQVKCRHELTAPCVLHHN